MNDSLEKALEKGRLGKARRLVNASNVNALNAQGNTALHLAAAQGHKELCIKCLEEGARLNVKNHLGNTPLTLAASHGHESVVELFLREPADRGILLVDTKNIEGRTALHQASLYGRHEVVKLLLTKGKASVDVTDAEFQTPLLFAVERGHFHVVKYLLAAGASVALGAASRELEEGTLLHLACSKGNVEVLKLLLEHCSADSTSSSLLEEKDANGNTPLMVACAHSHDTLVQVLLKRVLPDQVNETNVNGQSPLLLACQGGHSRVVQLLLEDVNTKQTPVRLDQRDKKGQNAFHLVGSQGDVILLHLLLEKLTDTTATSAQDALDILNALNEKQQSPLHVASAKGHPRIVKILLRRQNPAVDVTLRDQTGQTAFGLACQAGHDAVMKEFWAQHLFVNEVNASNGMTPLLGAVQAYQFGLVQLLLGQGADVNLIPESAPEGNAPLHVASRIGDPKLVQLLLDHGADATMLNRKGETALDIAKTWGLTTIMQLLDREDFKRKLQEQPPCAVPCPTMETIENASIASSSSKMKIDKEGDQGVEKEDKKTHVPKGVKKEDKKTQVPKSTNATVASDASTSLASTNRSKKTKFFRSRSIPTSPIHTSETSVNKHGTPAKFETDASMSSTKALTAVRSRSSQPPPSIDNVDSASFSSRRSRGSRTGRTISLIMNKAKARSFMSRVSSQPAEPDQMKQKQPTTVVETPVAPQAKIAPEEREEQEEALPASSGLDELVAACHEADDRIDSILDQANRSKNNRAHRLAHMLGLSRRSQENLEYVISSKFVLAQDHGGEPREKNNEEASVATTPSRQGNVVSRFSNKPPPPQPTETKEAVEVMPFRHSIGILVSSSSGDDEQKHESKTESPTNDPSSVAEAKSPPQPEERTKVEAPTVKAGTEPETVSDEKQEALLDSTGTTFVVSENGLTAVLQKSTSTKSDASKSTGLEAPVLSEKQQSSGSKQTLKEMLSALRLRKKLYNQWAKAKKEEQSQERDDAAQSSRDNATEDGRAGDTTCTLEEQQYRNLAAAWATTANHFAACGAAAKATLKCPNVSLADNLADEAGDDDDDDNVVVNGQSQPREPREEPQQQGQQQPFTLDYLKASIPADLTCGEPPAVKDAMEEAYVAMNVMMAKMHEAETSLNGWLEDSDRAAMIQQLTQELNIMEAKQIAATTAGNTSIKTVPTTTTTPETDDPTMRARAAVAQKEGEYLARLSRLQARHFPAAASPKAAQE